MALSIKRHGTRPFRSKCLDLTPQARCQLCRINHLDVFEQCYRGLLIFWLKLIEPGSDPGFSEIERHTKILIRFREFWIVSNSKTAIGEA
jgi:hypothetical protein